MTWIGLNLFSTLLCISGISAKVELTADSIAKIDTFIEAGMACKHIPGISVSVVTSDKVLLQKGYGYADIAKQVPVTKDTLFPIASTTKAFTTAVLAMLLEKTQFTWDTPLKEIDPQFKLHSELLTSHVTLRDILTHRTGIPGYFIAIMAGYPDDMSMADMIRNFHYHPPTEPLRTEFIYNNYMYGLAGYIAELLGDRQWEDIVTEKIFKPLNMTESTFVNHIDVVNGEQLAKPYVHKDNQTVEIDLTTIRQVNIANPAGGIVSNAKDMSSWIQFHLRQGLLESGVPLMSHDALTSLYETPIGGGASVLPDMTRPIFPESDIGQTYALGWMNSIYRGYRRIWHSGGILTYKSQVWLLPGLDAGIFIVGNGPSTAGSWAMVNIARYITDLLADKKPWLDTTTLCSFPAPWKNISAEEKNDKTEVLENSPLPNAASSYTGTYTHPAFGTITISTHSTENKLQMKMGLYIDADLFYSKQNDTFYTRFTDKYWYMDDRIPLQFRNLEQVGLANTFSTLMMPLCQPYDSVNKLSFQKDMDEYNILQNPEEKHNHAAATVSNSWNSCSKVLFLIYISMSLAAY